MQNIGVCCPGGGALCSAQAGGLKALYEWLSLRGLKPRAVRGASGGDLNSSIFVQAFADHGESITTMEHMWKTISHRKVHTLVPHIYPRTTGLFKLTPLKRLLQRVLDVDKLVASGVDYSVKATQYGLAPDVEVLPQNSVFFDMMVASASYPFMFRPVKIWGSYFGDSGINNNVPINRLIAAGCETIIIVRPYPRVQSSKPVKSVRMFTLGFSILGELMNAQLDAQISEVEHINQMVAAGLISGKRKIRLMELAPAFEPDLGVMEFRASKCAVAFDAGYRSARLLLKACPQSEISDSSKS